MGQRYTYDGDPTGMPLTPGREYERADPPYTDTSTVHLRPADEPESDAIALAQETFGLLRDHGLLRPVTT